MSAWDRHLGLRTLFFGVPVSLLCVVVIAATDEGGGFWDVLSRRLSMWAAAAPVLGMAVVLLSLRIARVRGEERALCGIGVSPLRARLFAVLAGMCWGCAGAGFLASDQADVSVLFPKPEKARVWVVESDHSVIEVSARIRILRGGDVMDVEPEALSGLAGARGDGGRPVGEMKRLRAAAALSTLFSAVFGPFWITAPGDPRRKRFVGFSVVLLLVGAFQAAAMEPKLAWTLMAAPLVLVAEALVLNYRDWARV